jgi:hydroxyacylglutathione hydrolase
MNNSNPLPSPGTPHPPMQIHTLFTGIANTHIVAIEKAVMIIDSGMPHQAGRILKQIRMLGHSPEDIRLILLTHGHIDHAGSAAALKRLTGAPIAMHRADIPLVTTPDLKIPPGRNATIDQIGGLLRRFSGVVPLDTFSPDLCLEDGESLCDFGFDAHVVHTPGHTPGSLSVFFEDGTVFVGDAILNLVRVSFPLWWQDPVAAGESACKILSLAPHLCYSGHGRPFDSNALAAFAGGHCAQHGKGTSE